MTDLEYAMLGHLLTQALALHETGEDAGEYTRGQAELIADAVGLPMPIAHELIMPALSSERTVWEVVNEIRDSVSEGASA